MSKTAGRILARQFLSRWTRHSHKVYPVRHFIAFVALLLLLSHVAAQEPGASSFSKVASDKTLGYTAIPLTEREGLLLADCTIKGIKARLLLDTGAGNSFIDAGISKRLKLASEGEVEGWAIGGIVKGTNVDPGSIRIGGFDTATALNSFGVIAQEGISAKMPYDGILSLQGLALLGGIVDYPNKTLYLRKPLSAAWPKLSGEWKGISWEEDGAKRVLNEIYPPVFRFADEQLSIVDGTSTRKFAIDYVAGKIEGGLYLYDPKNLGSVDRQYTAAGLIKIDGETMTVCLRLDATKGQGPISDYKSEKGSGLSLITLKQPGKKPPPADPVKKALTADGYTAVPLTRDSDGMIRVDAKLTTYDWPMLVDTGAANTAADDAQVRAVGGRAEGQGKVLGAGGEAAASRYLLRDLSLGKYRSSTGWQFVQTNGLDLSELNKGREKLKLTPIKGILGGPELLNGSAVIDLATNTLYLRPVKATVQPKLAGTWVLKASTAEGVRTAVADDKETMTVTADRMAFKGGAKDTEHGYHVKDEWSLYRLALFDPKADELADTFRYRDAGYFKLDGDKLQLVRVVDESKLKVSPTEFAAPKGGGLQLLEYERAKPAKK